MNNEEFFSALEEKIGALTELRSKGVTIAKGIVGETLTKDDLYFCASLDRCLRLTDGIITMLEARNLTCAGALLRLQMDNCMRTYAAFIAADSNRVIDCIISGDPINKEKDKAGNRMTDAHLKSEIDKHASGFAQTYDQASGFIHLSEKAFYQTVENVDNGIISIQVGHELPEKRNEPLMQCAEAFCAFVSLHYGLLNAVVESKKRFDAAYHDNEKNDT